jgi:hypothetical protein
MSREMIPRQMGTPSPFAGVSNEVSPGWDPFAPDRSFTAP